jgi:transcriptional regulator with XRE-family HTH domain
MPTSVTEQVARRVRVELASQRKTGVALAQHLGIKQAAFSRRLNGYVPLSVDELVGIAEYLGIPPADLLQAEIATGAA